MGQSSDQIRQELDQKRDDTARKIEAIESKVEDTVIQARESVEDTVQQVKEQLDFRRQVEDRPLMALGLALIGGFALGGILKKGDGGTSSGSTYTAGSSTRSEGGGIVDSLRKAAQRSGLDETLNGSAAALMSSVTDQIRSTLDRSFPGFSDKLQANQPTGNGVLGSGGNPSSPPQY